MSPRAASPPAAARPLSPVAFIHALGGGGGAVPPACIFASVKIEEINSDCRERCQAAYLVFYRVPTKAESKGARMNSFKFIMARILLNYKINCPRLVINLEVDSLPALLCFRINSSLNFKIKITAARSDIKELHTFS